MTQKNCFALFVGIDNYYNASIPNLEGCVQDATALSNYIQNNLNATAYHWQLKTLLSHSDTPPSRANIINAIKSHLGQAGANDVALLFYAGHGSKEKAPDYFREEDGNFQTLVPCDAREIDSSGKPIKNILDKELRYLFQSLWNDSSRQPEFIFIQDSCHATGATRKDEQVATVQQQFIKIDEQLAKEEATTSNAALPVARYTNPTDYEKSGADWINLNLRELAAQYTAFDNDSQPLATFLEALKQDTSTSFNQYFPIVEQIHFAACDKHQFAYEQEGKGGIFTHTLIEVLEASQNSISYHDLYNRVRMNIGNVFEQSPDLYVHHTDFMKRHEPFLGDLLQRGNLPPYREVDVFSGFFPLVPSGRREWQLKAGELDLLGALSDSRPEIPIEVFVFDQKPTGQLNAKITQVGATSCRVVFTTANFDRRRYRNKLYAMIPAPYLRRWRVPVIVEKTQTKSVFIDLFNSHGMVQNSINFSTGDKAVLLSITAEKARYTVRDEGGWYVLYDKDQNKIIASSAIRYTQQEGSSSVIKKENSNTIYTVNRRGQEADLEAAYELQPQQKDAITPLLKFVLDQYNQNPQQSIQLYFEAGGAQANAFVQFKVEQAQALSYYEAFINWTTAEKAHYIIKTEQDSFAVYPNEEGANIPVFQPTKGLSKREGFDVILSLQKMAKWRTVKHLYNPLQTTLLEAHQFEFRFKWYNDFVKTVDYQNNAHQSIVFQSWQAGQYERIERGEFVAANTRLTAPLHFLSDADYPSVYRLNFDLDIVHLSGQHNVYISTLLLDSNFAVLPLQKAMGNNLLPPQTEANSSRGTLALHQLAVDKPAQMRNYPKAAIPKAQYYLKIFIAYQRFDIAGMLQNGLPAPSPKLSSVADNATGNSRLDRRVETDGAGQWLSFTIPFEVLQDHE